MFIDPSLPQVEIVNPVRGCGKCCETVGRPPFRAADGLLVDPERFPLVARELPPGIPPELVEEVEAYLLDVYHGRTPNRAAAQLPCFWLDLDTRLCRNYMHRPKVCREVDCVEACLGCTLAPVG